MEKILFEEFKAAGLEWSGPPPPPLTPLRVQAPVVEDWFAAVSVMRPPDDLRGPDGYRLPAQADSEFDVFARSEE